MVAIISGKGTGLERSSTWVLGSRGQLGREELGRDAQGVYVNVANGNLIINREDEFLIGKGPDSSIGRIYNSQGNLSDDNGDNWKPTPDKCIWSANGVNQAGAIVTRRNWDGSEVVFTYDTTLGKYVSTEGEGARDTIVYNGEWHWYDGDTGLDEYYAASEGYHIKTQTDRDGNKLTYTYTAGKLARITTENGEYTNIVYSGNQLQQLTTYAPEATNILTRVFYEYDGQGRLQVVRVNLDPGDNSKTTGANYNTVYTYDGASTRVASIVETDGSYITFTYIQVGSDYKIASFTQAVATGVSRTTTFDYGVAGRTTITDPAGQKTILWYNGNNELIQISYPPENANTTPGVVQFAYNANGNGDVVSATLGPGNVIAYEYDTSNNLTKERDSAGNTIARTYSANGKNELLTETRYLIADPDGPGSGQPSTPVTTRYAYDSESHLRYVVSAEGFVTQYEYDAAGQQTAANVYAGNAYNIAGLAENVSIAESTLTSWVSGLDKTTAQRTETVYDGRGGIQRVTSYSKLLSNGLFDTGSERTEANYVYDQAGNLLSKQVTGASASEVFTYDGMGRMLTATDLAGGVTRTSFFDATGQTVVTHANGLSEVSTYNKAGELIALSQSAAGGNLVDLTGWPGNPGSVPSGQAIVPNWMNPASFTDETQWASTMGPDGVPVVAMRAGQLDASAEGGGNFTHEVAIDATKAYEFTYYFKLSDLNKHTVYFGLSGTAPATVENLDGTDNTNPYFFARGSWEQTGTLTADRWYKVVGYVLPQGASAPASPPGGVYDTTNGQKILDVTNFRWNPERPGNSAHARFFDFYGEANQQYSTYFYQPEIRQVSAASAIGPSTNTSLYRYDNLGRLRMTVDPTGRRAYMMYDSVGQKVADIDADGSVTEYRYDGSGNLTSTTRYATRIGVGQLVDGNGNPTAVKFGTLRPAADTANDVWTFQVYDAAQRLVQTIDGTGATTVLAYDGASRVTSTTTYANKLDSAALAGLKALAINPNRWNLDANGLPLGRYNLSATGAGTIDGANAYQVTVGSGTDWQAIYTDGFTVSPGQTVSATITVKAVGSVTMATFGPYGATSGWGADSDAYATIVSGPGQVSSQYGGVFWFSGLSTTEATRITITRTYRMSEWASPYFYLNNTVVVPGQSTIIAGPVSSSAPSSPILPIADASNDRVSRSFYDNDGRVIATLDGAGGLTQFVYDKAGRKVRELGAAKAAASGLWATGTLAQLITSVGTSASDRRMDYVYDARGFVRYTVDAAAHAVKYITDAAGNVIRISAYNGSITPAASYSVDYIVGQLAAAGLDVSATRHVTRAAYDSAGQKMFAIDAAGAVTAYAYDNVGNVIKQTGYATAYTTIDDTPTLSTMQGWAATHAADSGNRVSRMVYDLFGRVAYTVDAENYVSELQYDGAGRVTKEIRYAGTYSVSDGVTKESLAILIGAPSGAVTVAYAYDADGLKSGVTDGIGAVTHFTYDSFGRLIDTISEADALTQQSITRLAYDVLGRAISETRAHGTGIAATTYFAYDALGNLLTVTDPRNFVVTRTYDPLGRVLTVRQQVDASTGNDLITTNEYDAFGNLAKVSLNQLPDAANSYRYYDSLGRLVLEVDAERFWTRTVYTVFGDVASVTRGYDRVASEPVVGTQPTTPTNAADATTSFSYDKMGRVLTATDAMGFTEIYLLDTFGQRLFVTNKTGGVIQVGHDRLGRLYYEYAFHDVHNPNGTVQASVYYRNIYIYDSRGNLTYRVEAGAVSEDRNTAYGYDAANNLIQIVHEQVQIVADNLLTTSNFTPVEIFAYNARGERIQSVDAGGGKTLAYYDALGRKTDEVGPVGTLSHWTYDAGGNVTALKVYETAVSIPTGPTITAPTQTGAYRETTYAYDRANRLVTSTIANLRTGSFNGSTYAFTVGGVSTDTINFRYRVLRENDGNGNTTWTWFDKLGRKIAQVDREKYLTVWERDTNGNAKSETRYATQITGTVSETTSSIATLQALAGTSAADRTTNFTYDKNGRRLTESRLAVLASTTSGNSVSSSSQTATITYTYNGLGLVASKTEANGDAALYEYDAHGRLKLVKEASFVNSAGTWRTPTTETFYDALGNVVRTEVNYLGGAAANDRVTTYTYGVGGLLASTTDASGFTRTYGYDALGRVVKESWTRTKSDGSTTVTEATGYRYDAAGRLITQANATWNGSAWVFGDATRIRYNAYGEVTGRGLTASPNDTAVFQDVIDYDEAGRVWRSTAGDGAIKLMFYDKAGNATLTLSSAGADLSGYTAATAAATISSAGGTGIVNAVTSIAMFDKRGQQIRQVEPDRQLSWNGSSFTTATITVNRVYNGFGEVLSESDPRNASWLTEYSYNTMGRMIEKKSPTVNWTSETGAVAGTRPTENYYYDVAGRLVGVRDANGNLTTRDLMAGTGHGGTEAVVYYEYHADGGVFRNYYSDFREAAVLRNELNQDEIRYYDAMGRVTAVIQRGGLTDYYTYDGLGQRTRHYNNFLGSGNVERTDYDVQGRVVSQVAFGGDSVTHAYTWYSYLSTGDLGAFGAWEDIATYANGRTTIEDKDYFGRTVWRRDMGVRIYTLTFDRAGRTTSQSVGGETLTFSYFNTGLTASIGNGAGSSTGYGYDAVGNETSETTTRNYVLVQSATATFDALGRMASWAEAGNGTLTSGSPPASMGWEYDLNGNIRRTTGSYRSLDAQGTANGAAFTHDNWYRYDSMNRVTVEKGVLSGGQIVGGSAYSYDAAGRRATVTQTVTRTKPLSKYIPSLGNHTPRYYDEHANIIVPDDGGGTWSNVNWTFYATEIETYGYTAAGNLSTVSIAVQDLAPTGDLGTTNPHADAIGASQLRSSHSYDAMGRETRQIDWIGNGTDAAFDRTVTYNAKGQVATEITVSKQIEAGATTPSLFGNETTNYYGSGSGYNLGSIEHSVTTNKKDNVVKATVTTTDTYAWWDGPAQATINIVTDNVSGADTNYTTTNSYSASGKLASASIADGRPRTVTFVTNMAGEIIRRDESDNNGSGGDPHEIWYRYGGKQLGYTGNNGNLDTDYLTSIDNRQRTPPTNPNAFLFGSATSVSYADFSQALNPINSYAQGSDAGSYTVRAGDTLESIARNLWGDSSLWYQLASANGLSGPGSPGEGRTLVVPANMMSNAHNASTFRPYDPAKAIGDLSPTNPKPSKKAGGCGVIGMILLVAIAVAVTIVTSGAFAAAAASAASGTSFGLGAGITMAFGGAAAVGGVTASLTTVGMMAAGAIGAAAGSIVSQGVGVASGIQSKFSWKNVALSALSGGIGGGIGPITGLQGASGAAGILQSSARGALASVATQGIAVATGLQDKFSWAGVATAAVISGAQALASQILPGSHYRLDPGDGEFVYIPRAPTIGNSMLSGAAASMAGAAARSLLTGTDFGDNVLAALPDVVGSTVGLLISRSLTAQTRGPGRGARDEGLQRETMDPNTDPASRMGRFMFRDRYIDDGLTPAERIRELGIWVRQRDYARIIDKYFRFSDRTPSSYQGSLSFADSRAIVRSHLTRLLGTRTGLREVMTLAAGGDVVTFRINNLYDNRGSPATGDFAGKTVTVNVARTRNGTWLHTTAGPRLTPLFIVIGHELGHTVYGYQDVRPRDMLRDPIGDTIRLVENPLRAEVGEPLRNYYNRRVYDMVRINAEARRRRAGH